MVVQILKVIITGYNNNKCGAGVAQRLCNALPCDGPGFDSRWEQCKNRTHVLRKEQ